MRDEGRRYVNRSCYKSAYARDTSLHLSQLLSVCLYICMIVRAVCFYVAAYLCRKKRSRCLYVCLYVQEEAFKIVLAVFDADVLTTFRSKFTQFIIFYACTFQYSYVKV